MPAITMLLRKMASLMIVLMATFALHRRVADPPGGAAAWSRDGELITVGLSGEQEQRYHGRRG